MDLGSASVSVPVDPATGLPAVGPNQFFRVTETHPGQPYYGYRVALIETVTWHERTESGLFRRARTVEGSYERELARCPVYLRGRDFASRVEAAEAIRLTPPNGVVWEIGTDGWDAEKKQPLRFHIFTKSLTEESLLVSAKRALILHTEIEQRKQDRLRIDELLGDYPPKTLGLTADDK